MAFALNSVLDPEPEVVPISVRKRPAKAQPLDAAARKALATAKGLRTKAVKARQASLLALGLVIGASLETPLGRGELLSVLDASGKGPLGTRLRVRMANGELRLIKPETAQAV